MKNVSAAEQEMARKALEAVSDKDLWTAIEAGGFGDGNLARFREALLCLVSPPTPEGVSRSIATDGRRMRDTSTANEHWFIP